MLKTPDKKESENEVSTDRRNLLIKLGKYSAYTSPVLLSSFTSAKAVTAVSG